MAPLEESLGASRSDISLAYSIAFISMTVGMFITHSLLRIASLPYLLFAVFTIGGLGLAIARRIARAHGADLEVGSVEHEGTTVRLRLPALPDSSTEKGEHGVAIRDSFSRSSGEVCP